MNAGERLSARPNSENQCVTTLIDPRPDTDESHEYMRGGTDLVSVLHRMLHSKNTGTWLALVCDATSISMLAAHGRGGQARLLALRHADYGAEELLQNQRLKALESFVTEHGLRGCPVRIAFVGAGTVVQRMTLPPLNPRNRRQAVETHLMNFADGRKLTVALQPEPQTETGKSLRLLAGGVNQELSRSVCRACRRASLSVGGVTALTAAIAPESDAGALVQIVLGERTTTIQLFQDGKLISTRDVLFGRREFVQAYQRPILADEGPVTLSAEEADRLLGEVGVPVGMEQEIRPGIRATQLWPTLNPVLQRLMHEIQQSLTHGGLNRPTGVKLNLLALPGLPGLDEFLIAEMQLHGTPRSPEEFENVFLAALSGCGRGFTALDLRPPEERFGQRMARPALAAGVCALLIVFGNAHMPQTAKARVAELAPVAQQLQDQLRQAHEKLAENETVGEKLNRQLERRGALLRVLPETLPVSGPLKVVFDTLPPEMELLAVHLENSPKGRVLTARASYRGRQAASIAATRWGRTLSASAFLNNAEVTAVSGSGQSVPAVVEIRARVEGG